MKKSQVRSGSRVVARPARIVGEGQLTTVAGGDGVVWMKPPQLQHTPPIGN
jgi:hypothetical protein